MEEKRRKFLLNIRNIYTGDIEKLLLDFLKKQFGECFNLEELDKEEIREQVKTAKEQIEKIKDELDKLIKQPVDKKYRHYLLEAHHKLEELLYD